MIRNTVKTLLCILLAVSMVGLPVLADGSHGFYMECSADPVDNKSDGFMIDFYSDSDTAYATYWANANWHMYTEPTQKLLKAKSWTGGGAYAGLQILYSSTQRKGITSFWRYEYVPYGSTETQYLYADTVIGRSTHYDNEGSGTSCVMDYNWRSGTWYRELLYCWKDAETGETFCGTWYYDYDADRWDLFVYYNTHLVDSYIEGGCSQFLENFSERYRANVRSFRYRNIYFLGHDTGSWVGSPKVHLWTDGNVKAVGETSMGIGENKSYIWGSVDGASEVDSDNREDLTVTLNQTAKPVYGKPIIASLSSRDVEGDTVVSWTTGSHSTPQISYRITVTDEAGNELQNIYETRPDLRECNLGDVDPNACNVTLTLTDVFGQSVSRVCKDGVYGDMNGDDIVSIMDVTTLLSGLASGIDYDGALDMNNDGVISIADVTVLLSYLAEM